MQERKELLLLTFQKLFLTKTKDEHEMLDSFGGWDGWAFFGVFDGHGGRAVVEFVSENLPEVMKKMSCTHYMHSLYSLTHY
jgi:serine/threonine protein phosphatase PrpC